MDERFNVASYFLDRHLEPGDGRRVALGTRAGHSCYEEVAEMSNRAAGAFRDLGVGRRDRVLLALPDGPEQVAAFFGAARLGALAVPWLITSGAGPGVYTRGSVPACCAGWRGSAAG